MPNQETRRFAAAQGDHVAAAIDRNFTSTSESDSNLEPANVVDALAKIARGLFAIAEAIRGNVEGRRGDGQG